jgi:hypothetical protein
MTLLVSPCSHAAAVYAVKHWHYSETFPVGKSFKCGVWEDERFIGAVVFTWGSSPGLAGSFNLDMTQCVELVRVALREHTNFVTNIVAQALRILKANNPGLRLVVSFADPYRNHHGGIYQGGNWIYSGVTAQTNSYIMPDGKILNRRAYTGVNFGRAKMEIPANAEKVNMPGKHRYLYPLDRGMRRQILPLSLPYPHAVEGSEVSRDASSDQGQVRSLPTAPQLN